MSEKENGTFAVADMRNENEEINPSAGILAFIDDRMKYHLRDLEVQHSARESIRPTREELNIKSRLRSRLIDKLDIRDDYERLNQLVQDRVDVAYRQYQYFSKLDEPGSVRDYTFLDDSEAGVTVWWARTTWFYPATQATMWMDSNGIHFTGKFESHHGDLYTYQIRAVAEFHIGPDRMPPKGHNYVSSPIFEVSGPAFGFGIPGGIWDFGDQWSKCWLNIKQTVFTITGFDGIIKTIGSNSDSRQVIFTEDGDIVHANLPGIMGLPVYFSIPQQGDALIIELEWRFDVQVEDGGLWLGHHPDMPVCTISHPQWPVLRV